MFMHIGSNIYVPRKDVIAILNAKTINLNEENEFTENFMEFNKVRNCINDDVKSYIITCESRKKRTSKKVCNLYFSNISSTTLLKRL